MDLSVNRAAKEFMRKRFSEWYADKVQKQLDTGVPANVDLKMSTMKPLGARWLISLFDYLKNNNSIIKNGFKDIAKQLKF